MQYNYRFYVHSTIVHSAHIIYSHSWILQSTQYRHYQLALYWNYIPFNDWLTLFLFYDFLFDVSHVVYIIILINLLNSFDFSVRHNKTLTVLLGAFFISGEPLLRFNFIFVFCVYRIWICWCMHLKPMHWTNNRLLSQLKKTLEQKWKLFQCYRFLWLSQSRSR